MKKAKRYQDGGKTEDQYKKEGLESSKDEKVGFFERLRMGNIDNPSSEAYRRFGAGRAKMAEEARTPVPESAKESSDYSGRGAKSYSDDGMNVPHSSTPTMSESEGTSLADRLRRASPGSNISSIDGEGGYTSPEKKEVKAKPNLRKRVSQKFPVDMAGMKKRRKESMEDSKTKTGSGAHGFNFKSGGKVSSASSRADGIAQRGKTKGRMC
jgi:hypothetical protein